MTPSVVIAMVTGQVVADFVGRGSDTAFVEVADRHARTVTALVRSYTRGRGFTPAGEPGEDVAAVITTAAARLATNPAQVQREALGDYAMAGAFDGFTLAETAVLHRHRRRTA